MTFWGARTPCVSSHSHFLQLFDTWPQISNSTRQTKPVSTLAFPVLSESTDGLVILVGLLVKVNWFPLHHDHCGTCHDYIWNGFWSELIERECNNVWLSSKFKMKLYREDREWENEKLTFGVVGKITGEKVSLLCQSNCICCEVKMDKMSRRVIQQFETKAKSNELVSCWLPLPHLGFSPCQTDTKIGVHSQNSTGTTSNLWWPDKNRYTRNPWANISLKGNIVRIKFRYNPFLASSFIKFILDNQRTESKETKLLSGFL